MAQNHQKIIQRIKQIRINNRRSIHDCATILGISKEHYLRFEEGIVSLSLPEIEILANYLGVPPYAFFKDRVIESDPISKLNHKTLPQFKNLWLKMISAKFSIEREKAGKTLEEIHQNTKIPLSLLQEYEKGDSPIPLDHLLQISDTLSRPIEAFFSQEWLQDDNAGRPDDQINWQPEFPDISTKPGNQKDNPYTHMLTAIKKMPKEDQAKIAKIILEKIRPQ